MDLSSRLGKLIYKTDESCIYQDSQDPDRVIKVTEDLDSLEPQILSKCKHPNLVRCYEMQCSGDKIYLQLEKHGSNIMDEHLDALKIVEEIGAAIKVLHDNKYVHLDIHPGNILFSRSNGLILIDFGFSEIDNQEEMYFDTRGCRYAAPELDQSHYSCASDIWSLGLVALDAHLYPRYASYSKATRDNIERKLQDIKQDNIRHLLEWMLKEDPNDRPNIDQILSYIRDKR